MYHLDRSVVEHTLGKPVCAVGTLGVPVCVFTLRVCILVTTTLSVILLPVESCTIVALEEVRRCIVQSWSQDQRDQTSNLHQHCEWTGGKRAPTGCPRHHPPTRWRRIASRRCEEPFQGDVNLLSSGSMSRDRFPCCRLV